jgi:hypothetical protein
MRSQHRLIILAIIFAFCTKGIYTVNAVGGTQTTPDLEIALSTAQSTVSAGDVVWWQVSLSNVSAATLTQVELESIGRSWFWPEGTRLIKALAEQDRVAIEVPAVPLETGKVWPTLRVRYIAGKSHRSILAVANRPVEVIPISALVEAEVVPEQATAHVNHPLPVEVIITNRSPFTITNVNLLGIGADVEWGKAFNTRDMPPRTTTVVALTPTVRGESPAAILSLEYHWTDETDQKSSQRVLLCGDPFDVKKSLWSQIPVSTITALIGILLGLASWGTKGLVERRQREQVTRERVKGMLEIVQVQAEYGAQECVQVSLDLLQQLLSEEGLYTALTQLNQKSEGLVECVQELWQHVHRHNAGIQGRGGGTRTSELRARVERLGVHLRDLNPKPGQDSG